MKNLYFFSLFLCIGNICLGQVIEVSDSFALKLQFAGINFHAPQADITNTNNRLRASNCDVNAKLEANASYLLKKEKASIFILYRIKPMNGYGTRYSKAASDFSEVTRNEAIASLAEGESADALTMMTSEINQALNADWVRISAFSLQKRWKDCLARSKCYHIFAFKAGKGYAEIMVFYDEESKDFTEKELRNIITSISFK